MGKKRELYQHYASLGLVCDGSSNGCRPAIHSLGLSHFLTTPVDSGQAFHVYDIDLQLKGISKPLPSSWIRDDDTARISHLACVHELTFAAIGSRIAVFNRTQPVALWCTHGAPIVVLSVVGDLLVSVASDSRLIAWKLPASVKDAPSVKGDISSEVTLPPDFSTTTITHPHTYINKVLLGAADGRCMLVNLRTRKIVHVFRTFGSSVTTLEPAPVVDVVAVGTASGQIFVHNFRADETVVDFRHVTTVTATDDTAQAANMSRAVSVLSFRSDGTETLVSGDASGNMYVWDLTEQQLCAEAVGVHPNGLILAQFLPDEPILITCGVADNSIKVHVFDGGQPEARVLRSREGHALPPTMVRFCGYDGFMMVSAGLDRELRLVSAVREARNRSFSQASVDRKGAVAKRRRRKEAKVEMGDERADLKLRLPRIVALACHNARQNDEEFGNIVTAHDGLRDVYSWRVQSGATHRSVLCAPRAPQRVALAWEAGKEDVERKRRRVDDATAAERDDSAQCVAVSPCGNFALVGFADGRLHSFNLQSGRHQGAFDATCEKEARSADDRMAAKQWPVAHGGGVVAVCVDGCGDVVASAGARDRRMRFWWMHTRARSGADIVTEGCVLKMAWCQSSDLVAVACDDFSVYIYDAPTRKLARRFGGHCGAVTDVAFDRVGRRLMSTALDGTMRTWDLPSGVCIDVTECDEVPTSVAVAPSGEFVATTHSNSLAIRLWSDTSKFVYSGVAADATSAATADRRAEDGSSDEDGGDEETEVTTEMSGEGARDELKDAGVRVEPLVESIVTLSNKPTAQWTVLSELQTIRERNRAKEGVVRGEKAPFFLPTIAGIRMKFDTEAAATDGSVGGDVDGGGEKSKVRSSVASAHDERMMGDADDDEDANGVGETSVLGGLLLRGKTASAVQLLRDGDAVDVDEQIRGLVGRRCRRLGAALFVERLKDCAEFELTQAHVGVFLRAHGTALARDKGGRTVLHDLAEAQRDAWRGLRGELNSVLALSAYFAGAV